MTKKKFLKHYKNEIDFFDKPENRKKLEVFSLYLASGLLKLDRQKKTYSFDGAFVFDMYQQTGLPSEAVVEVLEDQVFIR